tara:strand:+ start:91 stop:330 length:240 start_codon:yes stop_codon:yes gene_type:complete
MPKYEVTATKEVGYKAIIEAPNEDEAWRIAKEGGDGRHKIDWKRSDDEHDGMLEDVLNVLFVQLTDNAIEKKVEETKKK